jgi:hypothetical protein
LHERALHALRARAAGSLQAAGTQLHDQIVDVSAGQILNGKVADLAAHWLQDVFIAELDIPGS